MCKFLIGGLCIESNVEQYCTYVYQTYLCESLPRVRRPVHDTLHHLLGQREILAQALDHVAATEAEKLLDKGPDLVELVQGTQVPRLPGDQGLSLLHGVCLGVVPVAQDPGGPHPALEAALESAGAAGGDVAAAEVGGVVAVTSGRPM